MTQVIFDERFDRKGMKEKLMDLPHQIERGFLMGKSTKIKTSPKLQNVVVSGMGGSAIAGDLLNDLLNNELKVPIFVNRAYDLPSFVGKNTLLFISSYSGNTEETVNAFTEGLKKNANIIVFTSGGKILKNAKRKNIPFIMFPPGYPPRCALGFSFFSMLGVLKNIFRISITNNDIKNLKRQLYNQQKKLLRLPNKITELAQQLTNKLITVYISSKLASVALRWQTQLNENSKNYLHINFIPEANHNEIVGLHFPKNIIKKIHIIFLRSKYFENRRIKKRFDITFELLKSSISDTTTIYAKGNTKLEEMFSLIYDGDFLSYYLALLNKVDPTDIKRIELLKEKLK